MHASKDLPLKPTSRCVPAEKGSAPTPFALFLSSLATCAGIYIKGFCDQRSLPSEDIKLTLDYVVDPVSKNIGKFIIKIFVPTGFPEKYDPALVKSASLCSVKRHLNPAIENEIIGRQRLNRLIHFLYHKD